MKKIFLWILSWVLAWVLILILIFVVACVPFFEPTPAGFYLITSEVDSSATAYLVDTKSDSFRVISAGNVYGVEFYDINTKKFVRLFDDDEKKFKMHYLGSTEK